LQKFGKRLLDIAFFSDYLANASSHQHPLLCASRPGIEIINPREKTIDYGAFIHGGTLTTMKIKVTIERVEP
jgi:hypothetical protein